MTRDEGMTGLIYNGSKALTDPKGRLFGPAVGLAPAARAPAAVGGGAAAALAEFSHHAGRGPD